MELSLGNIYTTLRSQWAQTGGRLERDREMIIADYLTLPSLVAFFADGPLIAKLFLLFFLAGMCH